MGHGVTVLAGGGFDAAHELFFREGIQPMLMLVSMDPMRFSAVCDTCRGREDDLHGIRAEVSASLQSRGWRLGREENGATCPECVGPPSVFPAGKVTPTDRQCSACGGDATACAVCHSAFTGEEMMSCRGERGHVHTRCATQRLRRFVPEGE